jgi:nucleotide-binding universal stress UspA family protein
MFRRILVCLDCSSFSERVLPYAVGEARKFDSQLILLHVCTKDIERIPFSSSMAEFAYIPVRALVEEYSQRCSRAYFYLHNIAARLESEGLNVEIVVLEGIRSDLADIVSSYAEDNSVDLIVMTTHGRKGFKRLFWGSVADSVTGKSSIPTLLVKSCDNLSDFDGNKDMVGQAADTLVGLTLS